MTSRNPRCNVQRGAESFSIFEPWSRDAAPRKPTAMKKLFWRPVVLLLVLCASYSGYASVDDKQAREQDDFTRSFEASIDQVFLAAAQVAASHWHLQVSDKDTHTLSFSTGRNMRVSQGFEMSVVCIDLGNGQTKVMLHPQKRAEQTQLFSWNEGNRISRDFLKALEQVLRENPQPTQKSEKVNPTAQPSAVGQITLNSLPDGAEVSVDGTYVGNAPASLRLPAGKHAITLTAKGYKPWTRDVGIFAGSEAKVNATLEQVSSTDVGISSPPATATSDPKSPSQPTDSRPATIPKLDTSSPRRELYVPPAAWVNRGGSVGALFRDGITGIVVTQVATSGSASKAGIRIGDAIVAIDGRTIAKARLLSSEVASRSPGSSMRITYRRSDTETEVTLVVERYQGITVVH